MHKLSLFGFALLLSQALPLHHLLAQTKPTTVVSPDKNLQVELFFTQGQLQYRVLYKGKPVVEPSTLGLQLNQQEIGKGSSFGTVKRTSVNETYAWRGVHSKAVNRYNEAILPVQGGSNAPGFQLETRVFNDGVALRYVVGQTGASTTTADNTRFTLPAGSTVWTQPDIGNYEGKYQQQRIEDVQAGLKAGPPLTVQLPGKQGYLAITEGGLTDFAGMSLVAEGKRVFKANLTGTTKKTGPVETPWRIIEVGPDLNTLVNCDIVHNVAPKPDPQLFPQGMATSWIQPGKSVWSWLAGNGGVTFENMKRFSQWAGQLGFQYNLVDEGWSRWKDGGKDPWQLVQELVTYSAAQNVKVWVWKAYPDHDGTPGLKDPAARKAFFKQCKDIGVVGLKIDFFNTESQEIIDFYQAALHDAAELQLMLDFHGANKPTGEARTWPNEVTREGVRGLENETVWPAHNATLPFTRYLAGHGDYTPLTFRDIGKGTTFAHQMASMATFTSPFLCVAANPEAMLASKAKDLIVNMPSVWDETIVLPASEIGTLSLLARRNGTTWYLAALNGEKAQSVTVDLGFLSAGSYQAATLADEAGNPKADTIQKSKVSKQNKLTLKLADGGGYLGRFTKE
ncbi:glycoside hydrolase family 97 protein [Hymenobacter aerilatus]|uniref:Glycoside hydrolase family 97 protein n=1 Tax=Hymenobacter aerilatus TaxID=2932251 RepID=A0A8T9SXM0_9BACT|nr:glycoside hydrolase family 97 protein [Hymenobacter aerilatus]UOR06595.1 glycoside hydrolase family 97 protein [Hymenobacter aerilatus]